LGRADGPFAAAGQLPVGRSPRSLVAGDFSGDGRLDLATANGDAGDVSVLLGGGDGTFAAAAQLVTGDFPISLVAADFNGDGQLDLTAAGPQSSDVPVLLGLGDGIFVTPDVAAGAIRSVPLVGDLNGDGVSDVAVLN